MKTMHRALLAACSVVCAVACTASTPEPAAWPAPPPPAAGCRLPPARSELGRWEPLGTAPVTPGSYALDLCPRVEPPPPVVHAEPRTRLRAGPSFTGHHLR